MKRDERETARGGRRRPDHGASRRGQGAAGDGDLPSPGGADEAGDAGGVPTIDSDYAPASLERDDPAPPPRREPDDPAARYAAVELLGRGGMGEVHRSLDTKLGREVALKTMLSVGKRATQRARTRFLREAKVQALLEHPAMCQSTTSTSAERARLLHHEAVVACPWGASSARRAASRRPRPRPGHGLRACGEVVTWLAVAIRARARLIHAT